MYFRMATLVINAPRQQAQQEQKKSFESTIRSGIGEGYAISYNLVTQLVPGCSVIILSKDQKLRAEGELVELIPTEKASNGIQRYNVHIKNIKQVPYKPEKLNRNGVSVI